MHPTIGSTFASQTAALGHQVLLTFYDDATGERTELSYATLFNWTSKAANLLSEELGLARHGTVALQVTDHWTGAVVAIAAWMVGASITFDAEPPVDVIVVPESEAANHTDHPGLLVVGAGMGGRVTADVPGLPFGDEVLAFADDYSDPDVTSEDAAMGGPEAASHADVLERARGLLTANDRLLVTAPLAPAAAAALLVAPIIAGASVLWCPNAGDTDLTDRISAERATHVLRHDGMVALLV